MPNSASACHNQHFTRSERGEHGIPPRIEYGQRVNLEPVGGDETRERIRSVEVSVMERVKRERRLLRPQRMLAALHEVELIGHLQIEHTVPAQQPMHVSELGQWIVEVLENVIEMHRVVELTARDIGEQQLFSGAQRSGDRLVRRQTRTTRFLRRRSRARGPRERNRRSQRPRQVA